MHVSLWRRNSWHSIMDGWLFTLSFRCPPSPFKMKEFSHVVNTGVVIICVHGGVRISHDICGGINGRLCWLWQAPWSVHPIELLWWLSKELARSVHVRYRDPLIFEWWIETLMFSSSFRGCYLYNRSNRVFRLLAEMPTSMVLQCSSSDICGSFRFDDGILLVPGFCPTHSRVHLPQHRHRRSYLSRTIQLLLLDVRYLKNNHPSSSPCPCLISHL